jgi:hypothetical protein
MSDWSANASNESPRLSPTDASAPNGVQRSPPFTTEEPQAARQSPTPSYFKPRQVAPSSTTQHPVSRRTSNNSSRSSSSTRFNETDNIRLAGAMSPRTVRNTLDAFPSLGENILRALADGLLATIATREAATDATISKADETIALLQERINDYTAAYQTPPDGYQANGDRLPGFTGIDDDGEERSMQWIKLLPDGQVAGYLPNEGEHDQPHVTSLYLDPLNLDQEPARPLPPWFRTLLTSSAPDFQIVRDTAFQTDDWALYAEINRYRLLDENILSLSAEIEALQEELKGARVERALCEGRLIQAQAYRHFQQIPHTMLGSGTESRAVLPGPQPIGRRSAWRAEHRHTKRGGHA